MPFFSQLTDVSVLLRRWCTNQTVNWRHFWVYFTQTNKYKPVCQENFLCLLVVLVKGEFSSLWPSSDVFLFVHEVKLSKVLQFENLLLCACLSRIWQRLYWTPMVVTGRLPAPIAEHFTPLLPTNQCQSFTKIPAKLAKVMLMRFMCYCLVWESWDVCSL